MEMTMQRRGFTLVEMLTVITIIAILFGVLMPAILNVRETARKRRAEIETKVIEDAIKAYFVEYNEWPVPDPEGFGDGNWVVTFEDDNADVITRLRPGMGVNTSKRIVFLEENDLKRGSGTDLNAPFLNPWGNAYRITIDGRYPGPECTDELVDGVEVESL